MRRDGRLSRMLHVLVHMDKRGGKATSETIALMLGTNPVVVRRTMASLKAAGILSSEGGHGGGWTLVRELGTITVRDVYLALGAPPALALETATDHPSCPVEQSAVAALDAIFGATEAFMLHRMGEISLAAIGQDFERRIRLVPAG